MTDNLGATVAATSPVAPAGDGAAAPAGGGAGGGVPPQTPAQASPPPTNTLADPPPQSPAPPASFPENWRQLMAGDDKSYLKTLERYTDPTAFAKAHRELQAKVSSGGLKAPPPGADAKPEELAAWRKENGLPTDPAGYVEKIALPNGMVMGEADKPVIERLAKRALEGNLSPDAYNGLVGEYYAIQAEQAAKQQEADDRNWMTTQTTLRAQWGPEYQANVNAILGLFPDQATRDAILGARTPDGRKLGGTPEFLQSFASFAREINPIAAVMPSTGGDPVKSAEARHAEISSKMRTQEGYREYRSSPALQKEFADLTEALQKVRGRAA